MWKAIESPLSFIRLLSVRASHRVALGANGSAPAMVTPDALYLRLFATHACTVMLASSDGETRTLTMAPRQAWIASADGVSEVQVGPAAQGGRLYINEFG